MPTAKNDNDISMSNVEMLQPGMTKYQVLEDSWRSINIMLRQWPQGAPCPHEVMQVRSELTEVLKSVTRNIITDISLFVNSEIQDPMQAIKMCDAASLMELFPQGKELISEFVADRLLEEARTMFPPGSEFAKCESIEIRFSMYQKQMVKKINFFFCMFACFFFFYVCLFFF